VRELTERVAVLFGSMLILVFLLVLVNFPFPSRTVLEATVLGISFLSALILWHPLARPRVVWIVLIVASGALLWWRLL
jgi:hypothetical protein